MIEKLKAFLDLVKHEDQIANALAFLTGSALSKSFNVFSLTFIFALASCSLGLMAANAFNQCSDVKMDMVNRPKRPIPSGIISLRSAHIFSIFLYSASAALAILVNMEFLILVSLGIFTAILYSIKPFRFKDRLIVSNISIALGYGALNFLLGWCVYKPIFQAPLLIIAFLTIFDLFANISKDYRDMKGDVIFNSRTVPVVLGRNAAIKLQFASLYLTFALPVVLFVLGFVDSFSLFLTPIGIILCVSSHKNLLDGKDVRCYMNMMLLYVLVRVFLILSLIL